MKIQDNIVLDIRKDGLEAYISILKNADTNIEHTFDSVIEEIKEHIKFGLDERILRNIFNKDNDYFEKTCIAKGKIPINGENGKIKCFFKPITNLVPKLKENGTVDYRELNSINSISKDDILAEIIHPKDGKNGIKVTGEEIPFKKGKTPKFKKGKNTYMSEDGLYLKSSIDGIVELSRESIKVSPLLVVDNVDNSVGNIDFLGSVTVNKDVLNGFKLKAVGPVEVKGSLEGGYIESQDNILIKQGIQGSNRLSINTKGSLGTRFIENAIINVNGNITAEAIMHSDVNCGSNILLVGKKGLIVGGVCRATYEIRAKIIGSSMATATVVEVGIVPDINTKYKKMEKEFESNKSRLKKIRQSITMLQKLKSSNLLDENKEKLYDDLIIAEKTLILKNNILEKEIIGTKNKMENLSGGKIKVADTIYPGVKVIIGKNTYFVREEIKRCTFLIENGEIRVKPY